MLDASSGSSARMATGDELELAHTPAHVARLEAAPRHRRTSSSAPTPGPAGHAATRCCSPPAALLAAVDAVLDGTLDNAFACCARPATTRGGAPDGLLPLQQRRAIAARWAQRERGARARGDRRLGRPPRQRDGGDLLRRPVGADDLAAPGGLYPADTGERRRRARRGATSTSRCRPAPATPATRTRSSGSSSRRSARSRRTCCCRRRGRTRRRPTRSGGCRSPTPGFRELTDRAVALADEVCGGRAGGDPRGRLLADARPARQPRDPRGARGARAAFRRTRSGSTSPSAARRRAHRGRRRVATHLRGLAPDQA